MGMSSLDSEEKNERKFVSNCSYRTQLQSRPCHVVESTKKAVQITKMKFVIANFAKLFSFHS